MSRTDFRPYLERVQGGHGLNVQASTAAFELIVSGRVAEDDLADFLLAQSKRGPTVDEIVGAARAMRAAMVKVEAPPGAIDVCGTGGDGSGTLNVSTAVALVVAACGVPVAKHGNRSMSSRTGAADVLEALGVNVSLGREGAEACLREAGIAFLFAQIYHPAMKHVASVRKRLGVRTIFNVLGPLCNPAQVKRQLMGVYAREWVEPIAHVLRDLGSEKAWVVHGDGLDELTTTGTTHAAVLSGNTVSLREIAPEDAGLDRADLAALKGGEAAENAAALRALLDGAKGAYRDIVRLNAAAALVIADKAEDLRGGAALAADAIDSGRAKRTLAQFAACSQRFAA